jgi:hypothetical protein
MCHKSITVKYLGRIPGKHVMTKLFDDKNVEMPYPGDMAYLLLITCPSYLIFLPSDPLPCSSFA